MNNTPILILAGGFGTRLQSVLNGLPKPMANINGKPFIYFLIKNWVDKGFSRFIFSLHFQPDLIKSYLEEINNDFFTNCNFEYIVETSPLGTGGAIIYAVKQLNINEEFIVINGDTWVEQGFENIMKFKGNCITLIKVINADRYGLVDVDDNNLVTSFKEKQKDKVNGFVNSGIYKFLPSVFNMRHIEFVSLENEILPFLVKQKQLSAISLDSKFIDIGIPEDYHLFCKQNINK